jgi:hypothetical protein
VTATADRTLTAAQARALYKAEVRAAKDKAAYVASKERVDELHERYKPLIPPSDEAKDAGKDVRQVKVGGFLVRVSTFLGGDYFALAPYRRDGHQVTPEMQPYVKAGEERDRWTVKDLRGPRDPDAVEPTT